MLATRVNKNKFFSVNNLVININFTVKPIIMFILPANSYQTSDSTGFLTCLHATLTETDSFSGL